jgi:3-oxoacyl-[acyl-carrier protein] reductase
VIAESNQPTASTTDLGRRPVALVTGAGRTISIGTSVARHLAESGWDVAFTYWTPYDARRPWGAEPDAAATLTRALGEHGAATVAIEADLASTDSPEQIFDQASKSWATSPPW